MSTKPFTVFGYGSLIFKPPPHVIAQVSGYLKGYVRRFAQKSHDHRGTPEAPGRVVTLIHKEDWDAFSGADQFPDDDVVWGVVYTIDPVYEAEIIAKKDGYSVEYLDVYAVDSSGEETVAVHECYVGRNDNPSFIGSEPLEDLAQTIWRSVGPSGPNKEYLYKLADAVLRLAPQSHDSHLFALETRLRELDEQAGISR